MNSACFLVSHGSSAVRSLLDTQAVRNCLRQLCPDLFIDCACLEGQPQTLTEQCTQFALAAQREGCSQMQVIPLFLLAGSHTLIDIPQAIAAVPASIKITITDYLGNLPGMALQLEQRFCQAEQNLPRHQTARLIIAHGSKQAEAMQKLHLLSQNLSAHLALWTEPASITHQVEELLGQGVEHIMVLPYFLFAGKTATAIAQILQPYIQVNYLPLPFTTLQIAQMIEPIAKSGYLQYSP